MRKERSNYPYHQSPLYKLRSKGRLAQLLGSTPGDLKRLAESRNNYSLWPTKPKASVLLAGLNFKPRDIQQPKAELAKIQRRLADLLGRIEKPDYLYSATKGRSYVKNARFHTGLDPLLKVDIKAFYSNVSPQKVRRFFESALKCSPDVARLLSLIAVYDERMLPTGSALSPILSFHAYRDLFDRLSFLADSIGAKFSLYVDDMVFSGSAVAPDLAGKVCFEIERHGLRGHKVKFVPKGDPRVITGVAVVGGGFDLPHKRRMKIRKLEEAVARLKDHEERRVVATALVGQYREAASVLPGIERRALRYSSIVKSGSSESKAGEE